MNQDNFRNRYKISQGFQCVFITEIIVNLVILLVVIFAIDEFWDSEEGDKALNTYYNQTYGGVYGPYGYNNPYANQYGYGNLTG